MTKMKTIFAVIFLALLIPVLLAAPESEAKVYQGKSFALGTGQLLSVRLCGLPLTGLRNCRKKYKMRRRAAKNQRLFFCKRKFRRR